MYNVYIENGESDAAKKVRVFKFILRINSVSNVDKFQNFYSCPGSSVGEALGF